MRLRPESFLFTLFLSALGGMTPLSIDMGLPALVFIGQSLHVPAAAAGLTLSFFLGGFALGPMALGPLSDRFGRRPVLLGGCALFTIAGLCCVLAGSLYVLLAWRFLEGVGAGAGATLSLAIVRDLFDGTASRVKLSYVSTVGTLAPMIAPTLGALVLAVANWRAIYGCLTLIGTILFFVVTFCFQESIVQVDRMAIEPRRLLTNYGRFFSHPVCLGYALVGSLNFGCMFSYVASSPLVMIGVLGVSPRVYGWTFAATAAGIMGGAFVNGKLSSRGVTAYRLLTLGLSISVGSTLALIAISLSHAVQVATLLPWLVLNTFAAGIIHPNASQGALHPMPDIAGVAAAVLGSMRMLTGAFAAVVVSFLFDGKSAQAMAVSMCVFALGSFAVYFLMVRTAELRISQTV